MLGFPVRQLVREKIGPLSLGNLKLGDWRHLTEKEVAALKAAVASVKPKRPRHKSSRRPNRKSGRGKPSNKQQTDSRKKGTRPAGKRGPKKKR